MTAVRETVSEITTPVGTARVTVAGSGAALAVLGHGAGGGIEAADIRAVTAALLERGWTVARVEQPYRVSGRHAPDRAPKLDAAWSAVVEHLRAGARSTTSPRARSTTSHGARSTTSHGARSTTPLLVGGRSSGARVACRTAAALEAAAVVCLAFPLHPPGRVESSRAEELGLVADIPLLVVQGMRDAFGTPAEFPPSVHVASVEGDHSLRRTAAVAAAVSDWLTAQRLT